MPTKKNPVPSITEKTAPPMARFFKVDPGKGHKRDLAPPEEASHYHIISRTYNDANLFTDEDKDAFHALIRQLSRFLGVEPLTSTILDNRFEILLRIPPRAKFCKKFEGSKGEENLIAHLHHLYSDAYREKLIRDIKDHRTAGLEENEAEIQKLLNSYRKRFCNLTPFVQEVKNRYSRWHNKKNNRRGTLWAERFESTLLETPKAIRDTAIQIELAAITEGLASHPKDYPWCGYAQALGGSKRARRGLCRITGHPIDNWKIKGTQKNTGATAYRKLIESAL